LTGNRDGAEELSYQEIAEIVGCRVGTVRSRLHRGRRMPQKALWYVADLQGMVADLRPAKNRLATGAMAAYNRYTLPWTSGGFSSIKEVVIAQVES
jgi:hypothetical protein